MQQAKEIEPVLMRPARFARLVDLGRSKIYEMIQCGEIRAIKVGGALRIPVSELERLKSSASDD